MLFWILIFQVERKEAPLVVESPPISNHTKVHFDPRGLGHELYGSLVLYDIFGGVLLDTL